VKKAYNTLMEEDRRITISAIIENTRKRTIKDRKQRLAKGEPVLQTPGGECMFHYLSVQVRRWFSWGQKKKP
jgi:hypothetical protein